MYIGMKMRLVASKTELYTGYVKWNPTLEKGSEVKAR